jgi:quinoprotein glucose dehydrogenase
MRFSRLLFLAPVAILPIVVAAPEIPKSNYNPPLAKASDDAQKAIPRFQLDKSLKVEVWAAEPMLANPVAFTFDEKGVCYVAETFRMHHGVTDTRGHMNWLDDDLACRTVADRVAKYKKWDPKKFSEIYEKDRERVRRIEDTTGKGKADRSTVFSDDFGRAEDGVGSGVFARKGNVYYACIPDLWLLKDTKNTGVADVKQSLSTGYGVHTGFIGHDLHGLTLGPDGRLYFTIGDRGLNVKTKEGKHLYCPDSGAVLRCELDGSNLEIFATGLRNPQELAFDDYGNLFTVDNNSDSGDQARFVHIVQGGDIGWRMGYQYESAMHDETVKQGNRGPWNYEQIWTPNTQVAYTLPPIRNFSNGPSGLTAYPGVGLADKYKGHFFLANFSGNTQNSGIFSFATKPKGASFEMIDDHRFMWNILATDCEFGPDGAFYVSDWVDGWNIPNKGRIYKISDAEALKNPAVAEAKKLLAEGMEKKSVEELLKLLGHSHRGVRMEAQFELAAKGEEAVPAIAKYLAEKNGPVARLHAAWALSMMARNPGKGTSEDLKQLLRLAKDPNPEIRCVVADAGFALDAVLPLLQDPEPRVRMHAAFCVADDQTNLLDTDAGRTLERQTRNRRALYAMLREDKDRDPYLRHAAAEALSKQLSPRQLAEATQEESSVIRVAAVVALRRQKAPEVAAFLNDADPNIIAEAARAINDVQIPEAFPKLAALITKPDLPRVVAYRVLNAHYLLGKPENAQALAAYATRSDVPGALRSLAVRMLGEWAKPPRRDYITGLTQSLPERPQEDARSALTSVMGKLFAGPADLRKATTTAATKLGIKEVGPFLISLVNDTKAEPNSRVDALNALAALNDPKLEETARLAVSTVEPSVRTAGRAILIKKDPAGVLKQLKDVLAGSNVVEQQGSLAILASNPSADTDALVEEWLDKLIARSAKPELSLEILEAAGASKSERIKRRLAGYENARPKDDLGKYREAISGGDASRGKEIFLSKAAVQCQRCHTLNGEGGEVGPPVNGAGKQTREYLLESIVLPSKAIAKGFESILITTLDEKSVTGIVKSEDEKEVRLMTAEGKMVTVKKSDIDERRATKSAMPDDLHGKLTKRELRDLVEFLSGLKEEWKK